MDAFSDPAAVSEYAKNPPRLVPGYHSMQQMAGVLLAERVNESAEILVHGAGGGLELKAFGDAYPEWSFLGVDPSRAMLELAKSTLGQSGSRTTFHEGYIYSAPAGPFDGATSILTLHFIEQAERLKTLRAIRQRLKPGAPFVSAHYSIPDGEIDLWMKRFAAFAIASGVAPAQANAARTGVAQQLPILTPAQDEQLLREAGFSEVSLFYVGFTFRGWVSYA